jgi:hypothetical protein
MDGRQKYETMKSNYIKRTNKDKEIINDKIKQLDIR